MGTFSGDRLDADLDLSQRLQRGGIENQHLPLRVGEPVAGHEDAPRHRVDAPGDRLEVEGGLVEDGVRDAVDVGDAALHAGDALDEVGAELGELLDLGLHDGELGAKGMQALLEAGALRVRVDAVAAGAGGAQGGACLLGLHHALDLGEAESE